MEPITLVDVTGNLKCIFSLLRFGPILKKTEKEAMNKDEK